MKVTFLSSTTLPIYTYSNILHPITICQPNFVRNIGAEDKGLLTLVVNTIVLFLYRTVYNFQTKN